LFYRKVVHPLTALFRELGIAFFKKISRGIKITSSLLTLLYHPQNLVYQFLHILFAILITFHLLDDAVTVDMRLMTASDWPDMGSDGFAAVAHDTIVHAYDPRVASIGRFGSC